MSDLSTDITSNAFNFGNLYTSGVDSRTGTFNLSFNIGNLKSSGDLNFSAMLGYNPLSKSRSRFGTGWSLNLTNYDKKNSRLSLSNGMYFSVYLLHGIPTCRYFKEKDLSILYKRGCFIIYHKDGTIEKLNSDGQIDRIISTSGHYHQFNYSHGQLIGVIDGEGKLLRISANSRSFTIVNSLNHIVCKGSFSGGYLARVEFADNKIISIDYNHLASYSLITRVRHPIGYSDEISYKLNAFLLPNMAPVTALPAVSSHTMKCSNFSKTKTYTYSRKNYLGYGLPSFIKDYDILYECKEDYKYSCIIVDDLIEQEIVYNKYHLIVSDVKKENNTGKVLNKIINTYHLNDNITFDEQPNQFLELKVSKEYLYNENGSERVIKLETDYDSYGNLIRQKDEYGIEKVFVYYQKSELPLDASDFYIPHLVKTEITYPSDKYKTADDPFFVNNIVYCKAKKLSNDGNFLLKLRESNMTNKKEMLLVISYQYHTNKDFPFSFSRVSEASYSGVTNIVNEKFQYLDRGDEIVIKKETIFSDSINQSSSISYCIHNHYKIRETDYVGNVKVNEYDNMGRICKESSNYGTPYQFITEYLYSLNDKQLDIVNNGNVFEQIDYDDFGRKIASHKLGTNGSLWLAEAYVYDSYDRVVQTTFYDSINGEFKSHTITKDYTMWGKVTETDPNGVKSVTVVDNVGMTETTYLLNGSKQHNKVFVRKNEAGSEVSVTHGSISTSQIYDGHNRLIESVNINGIRTILKLDAFGREIKKIVQPINGDSVIADITYDPRATDQSVIEIRLNGMLVGERSYDEMGRILSEFKAGGTTYFEYATLSEIPTKMIKPDGTVITNSIDIKIDKVLGESSSVGRNINVFTYDMPTGLLLEANNTHCYTSRSYYQNHLIKTEIQHGRTASYGYSEQGLLTSYTDFFGKVEVRTYSDFDMLTEVDNEGFLVTLSYDPFGRLLTEKVISKVDGAEMIHEYYYSDTHFNKISRKVSLYNSSIFITQKYEYDEIGNIIRKEITDEDYNVSEETYGYNDLNQMVYHSASGETKPSFNGIGYILEQEFVFDELSNITNVNTVFSELVSGARQIDNAEYIYNDNFLLTEIRHSNSLLENELFEYNENGQLSIDSQGSSLFYDAFDHLSSVTATNGALLTSYQYGASGNLVRQVFENQPFTELFYSSNQLTHELQGSYSSRLFMVKNNHLGRYLLLNGNSVQIDLSVSDYKNSQIGLISGATRKNIQYSAYGYTDGM